MAPIDIAFDDQLDIDLSTGDFRKVDATKQHQCDLLLVMRGHYKSAPDRGAGAINCIADNNSDELLRITRREYIRDGMVVTKLSYAGGVLTCEAIYK